MIGILQVVQGPEKGQTFFCSSAPLTIGRGQDNAIVLTDPQVSRVHCTITRNGNHVQVCDAGSAGGTWVNGERLTDARELQPGDVLAVGESQLDFKWSREDEKSTTDWQPNIDA
jgi:pSer/pThr/pTyr-binding forkhead associated (FHA) protein